MNIGHPLLLAACFACTAAIQAQTCSGGSGGGIDANGNQCGVEVAPAGEVDAAVWQRLSARLVARMPAGAATAQSVASQSGGVAVTEVAVARGASADIASAPDTASGTQTAAATSSAASGGQPIPANATILLLPAGAAIMLPAGASLTTVEAAR